ncbi:MAG: Bug family tripartite tricarboxylate transporter substrate binding protein [Propylenella sp.]
MSIFRRAGPYAVLAAALATGAAWAQDYPSQRITFIVGFAAGGYADAVARIVGEHVSNKLGQPVIVENRDGATSNVAARAVAGAAPDGYTVLVTTTAVAINATLYKTIDYSLADDLIALAAPVSAPETFDVHPSKPHTLAEFLDLAKSKRLTFGSAGVGSGSHLAMFAFLKDVAKVEVDYVPFKGGAPAIQAVVGNQVDALAATAAGPTVAQIKEGTIVCLGVAAAERYVNLPDCPTFAESGYPGFEASSWVGFFVPAGTDPAIVATLNEAINSLVNDPATRDKLAANGALTVRSPEETAAFVASEVEKWGERVKAAGVQVE